MNAVLILGLWWFSSGFEITRTWSDFFNGVGRVTGLIGTYLVLWQLLLMARLPWLEHAFGLERLAVLHKWNGYLVIGLLTGHGVFQTLGYQLGDGKDVASQLADFVTSYEGLLAAIVALGLFLAVIAVSITIARRHLAYETWYFVHLYAYLGVALAFSHQLATGVDFAGNPVFVWYWYLLYAVVVGLLIFYRVARPLLAYERHRFKVRMVEREASGVFSIYIGGRNLGDFEAEAGQFAIWRFLDGKRWWQAHPFSISAIPDGRQLRITVKNIGDFTSGVHALKPGTPVLVEGPFGKFTERPANRKVLLIAGGIGITPIRPLAEEMAADGFDVQVLYRAHDQGDVVFRREFDDLASHHGVRVAYLLTQAGSRRSSRDSWFEAQPGARCRRSGGLRLRAGGDDEGRDRQPGRPWRAVRPDPHRGLSPAMKRAFIAAVATVAGVGWILSYKVTAHPFAVASAGSGQSSAPAGQPSPSTGPAGAAPPATPTPGGVTGSFTGSDVPNRYGDVQVKVVISNGRIADVQPLQLPSDRAQSAYISQAAGPLLRSEVLQAQSAQIDIISGATYTSDSYARSVESALQQAHLG